MDYADFFQITHDGASQNSLDRIQAKFGNLPQAYINFLKQTDGAEACVNDVPGDSLCMYKANELESLNADYEVQKYISDILLFATDGGDYGLGFDLSSSTIFDNWNIILIPLGGLFREDIELISDNFAIWESQGFRYRT